MKNKKHSYVNNQIAQALIQLLSEKPLIDITITEITKKAQVGRASFYRNFSSTSDVLDYVIDNFFLKMLELIHPVVNSSDSTKWRNFLFQYIYYLNNPDLDIFVIKDENISIVLNHLVEMIRYNLPKEKDISIKEKYDLTAKIFMVNGVLLKWKETGMVETPEEIVDYLMGILDFYHQNSNLINK